MSNSIEVNKGGKKKERGNNAEIRMQKEYLVQI